MDEQRARFRISVDGSEIEIEGRETFVREHLDKFRDILRSVRDRAPREAVGDQIVTPQSVGPATDVPDQFGEYLARFPKSITETDQVLIAGYFVQFHSGDDSFGTREANKLLKEVAVKVSNASRSVRRNEKAGRVFSLGKGKYRVSQPKGPDWLNQLIAG